MLVADERRRVPEQLRAPLRALRTPLAAATVLATALATALTLPALWWEQLHVDENVTLVVAPRSFPAIVDRVFVERGGAPVHFFVEHFTLQWPGGLIGLRGPSLLALLLALPAVALFVRELCGRFAAGVAVVLVALAPLAVELGTFARMYSLLLAATAWASWGALRAARTTNAIAWAAAAAGAGALVYVHPLAPLYSSVVLAGAFVWSRAPLRSRLVPAALAGAAYIVVQLPYLLHGFDVNRDRYVVEAGGGSLVGTAGRSPAEQILHALTPADTTGVLAFAAFAVVGLAVLAATRTRAALVLLLWIAVPIAFFSFVSAEETKFYDRYVIPQLPAALAAAAAGCAGLLRLGARAGPVVAVAAALALAGAEAREDVDRLRTLRALDLPGLVDEVRPFRPTGVLFRSAGRSTYTREPWLIGRTVWLELEGLRYEREKSCRDVRAFALGPEEPPRIGLWIFRGRPQRIEVALERLAPVNAVVSERVSDQLLLVRSARRETPRRLVELGNLTRRAWLLPERGDGGTRRLIKITGRALLAADRGVPCEEVDPPPAVPYGKAQSG